MKIEGGLNNGNSQFASLHFCVLVFEAQFVTLIKYSKCFELLSCKQL